MLGMKTLTKMLTDPSRVAETIMKAAQDEGLALYGLVLEHIATGDKCIPIIHCDENGSFYFEPRWLDDRAENLRPVAVAIPIKK